MIKLKDILTELLLQEALPPSVAKKYTSIKQNPKIKERLNFIFTALANLPNASTSKRGDRVYFPFSKQGGMVTQESPVKKEVEMALQGTEFKLKDYKTAVAIDKYGRDVKLGKALTKIGKGALVNKVNSDKTREGAQQTDFMIVFSKHPYDVAGMSTDRGWTSCMNVYGGANKEYVSQDIKEGSFICYITKPSDTNLNNPVGRVLIKPFINTNDKNDVLYSPEQKSYGTVPSNFLPTVDAVIEDVQGEKIGSFELEQSLYCDSSDGQIMRAKKNIQDIIDGKTKPKTVEEVQQILDLFNISKATINSNLTVDVDGHVNMSNKRMKVIPVQFGIVSGYFDCRWNNLTSLEGAPKEVSRSFKCNNNRLTSLQGAPREVGLNFWCDYNELTSLEGAPEEVGLDFSCTENNLRTLEGAPHTVGGDFFCHNNLVTFYKSDVKQVSNVNGEIVND